MNDIFFTLGSFWASTLGISVGIIASTIPFFSYHFYLARRARIISDWYGKMADPETSFDEFWEFLREEGFSDGTFFYLEGRLGHGIATPESVAKILARVVWEEPSRRREVVSALCVFYFKTRAPITKTQGSMEEMTIYILKYISHLGEKDEKERLIRIWHDFSKLAQEEALREYRIKNPKSDFSTSIENTPHAKARKMLRQILKPKPKWFERSLPAKADTSAEKNPS